MTMQAASRADGPEAVHGFSCTYRDELLWRCCGMAGAA
jgi:hypothetical protein